MAVGRLPTREASLEEVAGYVADVQIAITVDEIPPDVAVPPEWRELLRTQAATGAPSWPPAWSKFRDELPAVQQYLRESLRGVAVLIEPGRLVSLLYIATLEGGEVVNCYRGWPPVGQPAPGTRLATVWHALPSKLQVFYSELHDGWTELASGAGGPTPSATLGLLSDPDWDLDPDVLGVLPYNPSAVLLVFSNSAGDYLALDTSRPDPEGRGQGIIWPHDDQPRSRLQRDFWGVLNAWSGTFFEEAVR